jgi:plastocyanin
MPIARRALLGALGLLVPAAARAAPAEVHIDNFVFTPATLTVRAGTPVRWTNRDDIPHTVTSAAIPPLFRSPVLDTDEGWTFAFAAPGRYPYFCSLHPHMQGEVVVT